MSAPARREALAKAPESRQIDVRFRVQAAMAINAEAMEAALLSSMASSALP